MTASSLPFAPYYLPDDSINEATKLISQAIGIIDLLGQGGNSVQNKGTLSAVAWTLEEKMDRLHEIVTSKTGA